MSAPLTSTSITSALDLDVDGENNTLVAMDPEVKPNTAGRPAQPTPCR
ncbi:hypothetical protein LNQ52_26750 [Klebsiella pneumoniae subsp. pneumoniae]|nr:hypothetical protein [Klebsiella pneumoniae subsp. pneumoniae]